MVIFPYLPATRPCCAFPHPTSFSPGRVQVSDSTSSLNGIVHGNLKVLEVQYSQHRDSQSIIRNLKDQLDKLVEQMVKIPFWDNSKNPVSLEELAVKIEVYDWYR